MKTVWCRIWPSCGTLPDAPARRSCWRRRRSRCFPSYPLIAGVSRRARRPAACTRHGCGHEEFGGETHVYCAGLPRRASSARFWSTRDHIVFNSFTQLRRPTAALPAQQGSSCRPAASIRSAPRSRATTRSTTRAVADSRLGITIGHCSSRSCCRRHRAACTSTRSASRIPTRWCGLLDCS